MVHKKLSTLAVLMSVRLAREQSASQVHHLQHAMPAEGKVSKPYVKDLS